MIGSLVPGGPSPHVHAKRERRRAEILRVALRAFRERGYHATTLDSIAEQLGVGKTALYHYFPDKQAILLACHRESLADLERIVAQARRLDTARERLRYVIMEHVRVMTEAFGASPLAFEVGALSAERQAEIVDGRDRYERALRDIIEQGMKLGTFRRADSKVTAFAILGALNGIARWYRPEGPLDARALGELFAAQLMDGLAAGPRRNAADDAAGAEGASDIAHATTAAVRRDAA
ncbi:MAG TPA: TetR/AcrR family transcriptional regulator, partial [Candidatus Eisenbacteria bacterium]